MTAKPSSSAIQRRATAVAAALAGGSTLVALCLPLLSGDTYFGFDLTSLDVGMLCELKRVLAEGLSPWLSPHLGNGAPLFARPTAQLLYPLRWLILTLPPDLGASLQQVLHLAIGAAATAWLCRSHGARPGVAACAGLCFALSGTALNLVVHSIYAVGAAWIPLCWAAARRLAQGGASPLRLALLATGLLGLLLGGEPQSFAIAVACVGIETALPLRHRRARRRALTRAGLVAGVLVACAAIGAAQWAPFFGESALSMRSGELSALERHRWSFSPELWPAALWPGSVFVDGAWHLAQQHRPRFDAWNPAPYLGTLFLAALLSGLGLRRVRIAVLVMLAGLLLSLGDVLPVLPLLESLLPPLRLFRYPQKYLLITTLAAVVVVARCLDAAWRSAELRRRLVTASAALLALQLGLVVTLGLYGEQLRALASWPLPASGHAFDQPFDQALRNALLHGMLFPALFTVGLFLKPRLRRLVPLILVVDLAVAGSSALHLGPSLSDLRSPLSALQSEPEPLLCVHRELRQMTFATQEAEDSRWAGAAFERSFLLPEWQACDGVVGATPYSPLRTRVSHALKRLQDVAGFAAARALGCTHLVSDRPGGDDSARPERFDTLPARTRAFLQRGPKVWRIGDPIPTAFVVRSPRLVDEAALATEVAATRSAAGVLALIDDPHGRLPAQTELPDANGVSGVELEWPARERAQLRVQGSGPALIGLRTSFQLGWRAYQGDVELPVLRSAGYQVAVLSQAVEAGPIRLRYRPRGYTAWLLLSALGGCALLATLAGVAWFRRRAGGI